MCLYRHKFRHKCYENRYVRVVDDCVAKSTRTVAARREQSYALRRVVALEAILLHWQRLRRIVVDLSSSGCRLGDVLGRVLAGQRFLIIIAPEVVVQSLLKVLYYILAELSSFSNLTSSFFELLQLFLFSSHVFVLSISYGGGNLVHAYDDFSGEITPSLGITSWSLRYAIRLFNPEGLHEILIKFTWQTSGVKMTICSGKKWKYWLQNAFHLNRKVAKSY